MANFKYYLTFFTKLSKPHADGAIYDSLGITTVMSYLCFVIWTQDLDEVFCLALIANVPY